VAVRKTCQERRAEIVAAALDLAAQIGADRVTTGALARRVGLSQAAVFRHFPRKKDIWLAVAEHLRQEMTQRRWPQALAGGGRVGDRLRAVVRSQLHLIQTTPAILALLFSRELHAESEELRLGLSTIMDGFRQILADLIREDQRGREFDLGLEPGDAATLISSLVPGLALAWSLSGRAFSLVDEGGRLFDLLFAGLLDPAGPGEIQCA